MTNYLQLDKVQRAYRMVQANLPTFDEAWHTTNKPTDAISTFQKFFESSVYWFDAKYPGLQIPPAVASETAPTNLARAAVYTSYMGKIEPVGQTPKLLTTDFTFSDTFSQYRMDYYMGEAVREYVSLNPSWDPYAYALKYSDTTLNDYVYPAELKQWLSSSELNKIMDMVREAEGWLVKYAAQLPTLSDSFKENVLGSVLDNIGINLADIQATAANGKYSFKQALFLICAYLDKNGQTLSDVYVPEYPATDLAEYYLSNAVIEANNFSTRDIDFIYQGAKLIEADLLLDGQLANRNADLLVAFDGSAEKLTAATLKEKAGRLMYVFYKKTRATLAKEVSGVIKPQPFSRYFYPLTEAAVKTGFTNAKVSERDLYTGRENAFSIALKVQTETFKADIAATSAFIDAKYPLLKGKINPDTSLDTNDKKAEAYAYFVATADIGLRPKPKSQLDKYFPGASQSYLTRAKISEQDFFNIDQIVTNSNTALFRFNSDLVTELGITAAVTGADAQEIVFRVNAAREYAEERIAYYEKLYKLPIVDHLRELGVTADMLSEINLSFDQVADNPEQWNTELIGNMLFSYRYGKICKPAPVYVANCQTGWQSPLAVAEITIPLGLTQQIAMTKQYSLLEVMQLSRQYVNWTDKDARKTNNIEELAKSLANDELDVEFVQNYFDGEFLSTTQIVQRGYLCQSAITGLTGVTELQLPANGPKVCDYLSNSANTDVFRDKSRADTIVAPKTNIDIMRNSFHKKFMQANFISVLDAAFVAANGGSAAVHADYEFGNFIKAAAQFPAFCSVEDNKQNTVSCEKQIIGLLAVVGHYSSGFKDSLSAAIGGCAQNNDNNCLNAPAVETLEYHYISKLMNNSNIAISDAIYKAWGMGKISGPREFLEFFSRYPEVATDFTGFTKPADVRNLLTAAPEMNWATAFYRWFQPSKVNFEVKVTESQDIGDGAKNYFYVEDSYLVPSFDTLMLGNFGDFLDGANDFTTMFPTSQNGFRGIMKVLLGGNCHNDAGKSDGNSGVVLAKTSDHTKLDAMFTAVVANWKIKDADLVEDPYNQNKDCSAVGKTQLDVNIPNIPKFNRKNYYAPTVTTVEPAPFFTVRQFQGSPGQCFNVHIETPYSIFSQDAYARCVAIKMLSNYGQVPAQGAAFDFSKLPDFTYFF